MLIWNEKNDIYMVRSGYCYVMRMSMKEERCQAQGDWDSAWSAQVPPKVWNLIWRICRSCLPTRDRLNACHVFCPLHYELCENYVESDWHVFFDYHTSADCWTVTGLATTLQSQLARFDSVGAVLLDVCVCEPESTVSRVLMIIWGIWQNLNYFIWNQKQSRAGQIVNAVQMMHAEWRMVQNATQNVVAADSRDWNRQVLAQRDFRCSMDDSFFRNCDRTGYGGCIRGREGDFVKAWTGWMQPEMQVYEGEAVAFQTVMRLVQTMGVSSVTFLCDSQVDAIPASTEGLSEFNVHVNSTRSILALNCTFEVNFIGRQANMIAHSLARAAISYAKILNSIESPIHDCLFLNRVLKLVINISINKLRGLTMYID